MRRLLFLFVFFLNYHILFSQSEIDSLKTLAKVDDTEASVLANLFNQIALLYKHTQVDSTIKYANLAYEVAIKNDLEKELAWALVTKSYAYWFKALYPEGLKFAYQALEIFEKYDDSSGILECTNAIAVTLSAEGEFAKAIPYYEKTVKLSKETNDPYAIVRAYQNLGRSFYFLGNYAKALENMQKIHIYYDGKDAVYAGSIINIADVYQELNDLDTALMLYEEALEISEKERSNRMITYSTIGLAQVYQRRNKLDLSNKYAIRTLNVSKEIGYSENIKNAALVLSENFKSEGDYQEALSYYYQYIAARDSMFNLEKEKELKRLELQQKENQIGLLQEQNDLSIKVQNLQKAFLVFFGILIFVSLLFVYFLIRSRNEKEKINIELKAKQNELERQNQEIKTNREEILQQSKLLNDANNFKSKIFAIVSHDLKGPFQALMPMVDHIGSNKFSAEEYDILRDRIRNDLDVIFDMMNNLLVWSKGQMEGESAEKVHADLHKLVSEKLKFYNTISNPKGLNVELCTNEAISVDCYPSQISAILRNLVGNAIKYSNPDSLVSIGIEQSEEYVTLYVKDKGVGISKEVKHQLEESQTIVSSAGTKSEKGSGLGLFICRELVNNHHGDLWFTSKEGEGSTFYFSIRKVA